MKLWLIYRKSVLLIKGIVDCIEYERGFFFFDGSRIWNVETKDCSFTPGVNDTLTVISIRN